MPVAAAIDERHLARHGLTNYWGYNPVALFVPDPRLAPGGIAELRRLRRRAARGRHRGHPRRRPQPHRRRRRAAGRRCRCAASTTRRTTGLRADDRARYVDDTGCGNTLALDRPPVLRLAMDALRYYAEAAGVDGFRFDLATTLGRRDDGFDPAAPLLQAIAQDPVLRELKLDRRALGRRARRAPARRVPGAAGASGTTAIATPCGASGAATRASSASSRPGSPARPTSSRHARGRRRARSISSPRTTASRSPTSSPTRPSTTRRTARTTATAPTPTFLESRRRGPDRPTPRFARRARARRAQPARHAAAVARHADAGDGRRARAHAARQQQRLRAGQRADLGRLGHAPTTALVDFVAALIDLRRRHPALRADRWLTGAPADASGIPDVEWRRPDGRR